MCSCSVFLCCGRRSIDFREAFAVHLVSAFKSADLAPNSTETPLLLRSATMSAPVFEDESLKDRP